VTEALKFLAGLAPEAVLALLAWIRGEDSETEPAALAELPDTLKSEIELARLEARSAKP
jgi:hypothetical protein